MNDKPTRWDYPTTTIVLVLCAAWAYAEYKQDPGKIPFEPLIAVVTYGIALLGYLRWKKGKEEQDASGPQHTTTVKDSKSVVANSTIKAGGDVHIGDTTNTTVNNEGAHIKNQFNGGTFNDTTFN